jgi:hypothetical protein
VPEHGSTPTRCPFARQRRCVALANVNADEAARASAPATKTPDAVGSLGVADGPFQPGSVGHSTLLSTNSLSSYRNPSGRRARHQLFHSGEIRWAYESVGRMSLMLWGGRDC